MCKINIILNTTAGPAGATIISAQGRYKLIGATVWTNFPEQINLSAPQTPDITIIGTYNLQVNVTNSLFDTSDWADSNFSVNSDCEEAIPISLNCPNQVYGVLGYRNELIDVTTNTTTSWTATVTYLPSQPQDYLILKNSSGVGSGEVIFTLLPAEPTGNAFGDITAIRKAVIRVTDDNNPDNWQNCIIDQLYYTNEILF